MGKWNMVDTNSVYMYRLINSTDLTILEKSKKGNDLVYLLLLLNSLKPKTKVSKNL